MAGFQTDPLYLVTVLAALIVCAEWLSRRGAFRHIGSALIVIVLGAILANLRLIPAGSTAEAPVPVYDAVFAYVAPIGIFWLLLPVNLRDVLRAGLPLIPSFSSDRPAPSSGRWPAWRSSVGPRRSARCTTASPACSPGRTSAAA